MVVKRGWIRGSSKHGQVTVFIIVGIIILFAFAGILYLTKSQTAGKLSTEAEPIMSEVPQTFKPLQEYTTNCLEQLGEQGLLLLGQQGGYIHPELVGKYSASNPTEADGLDLEPLKVPYWHYNTQPNKATKVQFASLKPKLFASEDSEMSIESQLSRYVDERLNTCLQNYDPFLKQGFQVEVGKVQTTARVAQESVNFFLDLPITAKKGEAQADMDTFYVKIPLALKSFYDAADEVTMLEQNFSFLEKQTMDLIQSYSSADINKLPPTSELGLDAVPKTYWSVPDVKEKVKQLLVSYVPVLRVSSNAYRYAYPVSDLSGLYQKTYDNMILPVTALGSNVDVLFDYFGWEPYFSVNSRTDVIKPDYFAVNFDMLNLATQNYHTLYDVSYPVLVTISDSNALGGKGYNFVFALESNVRKNAPATSELNYTTAPAVIQKSLVCNENQRTTELVKTIVIDSYTREPLNAVQLTFSIPGQDNCLMGETDQQGTLESKYPPVYGGVMSFMKEEYLTDFYPIDTYKYKNSRTVIGSAIEGLSQPAIAMHKYKYINVSVKKKLLEKCIDDDCFNTGLFSKGGQKVYSSEPQLLDGKHEWYFTGASRSLTPEETGTITLKRIADVQEGVYGQDFSTPISVTGANIMEVRLVPGRYEVTGLALLNQQVIFPEEERCSGGVMEAIGCGNINGCCITLDETVMEQFLEGQLSWETPKTYLEITPEQLYGSNQLTFYLPVMDILNVPQLPHKRIIEDLQVMGEMANISQLPSVRSSLKPQFS